MRYTVTIDLLTGDVAGAEEARKAAVDFLETARPAQLEGIVACATVTQTFMVGPYPMTADD